MHAHPRRQHHRSCRIRPRLLSLAWVALGVACAGAPAPREGTAAEPRAESQAAVRAFFETLAGCDPQCAGNGGEGTPLTFDAPELHSSVAVAGGHAQLWSVRWGSEGPEHGRALILAVPDDGTTHLAEGEPVDPRQHFPAWVAGQVLLYLGDLERSHEADNLLDARETATGPAPLRLDDGLLRTSFEVHERRSFFLSFDDCAEIERGPQLSYRVEAICAFGNGTGPTESTCGEACAGTDRCETGSCAAGPVRCRTVLGERHLIHPGGLEDCNGPSGEPRRATEDEQHPREVQLTTSETPLDALVGVPAFETLCPTPSTEVDCDEEQRAAYRAQRTATQ